MRKRLLLLFMLVSAAMLSASPQDVKTIRATTEDGRTVVLKPDGTWNLAPPSSGTPSGGVSFVRSANASKKVEALHGKFTVWYDSKRWSSPKTEDSKITLQTVDGKGYAMILSDALPLPKGTLKEVALHNARNFDPNVQLISEESRVVNGREVLCLQFEATYAKVPFTYYGYYYGGNSGSIQLVTFTAQSQFSSMKSELTNLLNGLEVAVGDIPVAEASPYQPISLNDGKIKVSYDTRKWSSPRTDEKKKVSLTNVKGTGWAIIIPEALSLPLDSFPEIALHNAKNVDPDAKIIFREKRTVHGQEVWCLKISATVNTLPIIYYGYYYSGPAGSVQVLTYTTNTTFDEMEKDFAELLNSLQIQDKLALAEH